MPRKLKRKTLAKGVYLDGASLYLRVMVNGETYTKRMPLDTPIADAITERKRLFSHGHTERPTAQRYTLDADIPVYLKLQTHLASYRHRKAMLEHWRTRLTQTPRHRITPNDIRAAQVAWLSAGTAPKTVNHRVNALRHLYHVLDGPRRPTPCDDVASLHVPKTPIQRVSDDTILAVDAELQRREQNPRVTLRSAKTRARFRVLVSTGRRPSEVMRAKSSDVNLTERVWVVRDGKGGWSPGVYLNDDMLAAWRLFIEADAWGHYNTDSFACAIREAGWPKDVRPYNARHTTWITAVERGADMADVQVGAGHTSLKTTRIYTGVRNSRMQGLSERLAGRFGGFPVVMIQGTDDK